jgi:hypothetical protein
MYTPKARELHKCDRCTLDYMRPVKPTKRRKWPGL